MSTRVGLADRISFGNLEEVLTRYRQKKTGKMGEMDRLRHTGDVTPGTAAVLEPMERGRVAMPYRHR